MKCVVCLGKAGPILRGAHSGMRIGGIYGTSAVYTGADHREAASTRGVPPASFDAASSTEVRYRRAMPDSRHCRTGQGRWPIRLSPNLHATRQCALAGQPVSGRADLATARASRCARRTASNMALRFCRGSDAQRLDVPDINIIDLFRGNAWQWCRSGGPDGTTLSMCWPIDPSSKGRPSISDPITAPSSSPKRCASGSWDSASIPSISMPKVRGRTAISKASMPICDMNCLTAIFLTALRRRRSSPAGGAIMTTAQGRRAASEILHRPRIGQDAGLAARFRGTRRPPPPPRLALEGTHRLIIQPERS